MIAIKPKQAARDLWEYGEDDYVDRVFRLSDEVLNTLGKRAYKNLNNGVYEKGGKILSASGYDLGYITALTIVEYFESDPRILKRSRRRNLKDLPKDLIFTESDYLGVTKKKGELWAGFKRIFAKNVH
jgi:hypothetical protein